MADSKSNEPGFDPPLPTLCYCFEVWAFSLSRQSEMLAKSWHVWWQNISQSAGETEMFLLSLFLFSLQLVYFRECRNTYSTHRYELDVYSMHWRKIYLYNIQPNVKAKLFHVQHMYINICVNYVGPTLYVGINARSFNMLESCRIFGSFFLPKLVSA